MTGHSHTLTAGQIFVNEPNWEDNANFYVMVPEGAQLVHAEHAAITLPEGVYKVVRQREVTGYVRD
ncbi:MAG: hypothetical protein Q8L86_12440 [Vicinamibacterales bacterium]|nr:hypothetical protein [Vicinamibacterales bacterium]